jgi:hypothetical protein
MENNTEDKSKNKINNTDNTNNNYYYNCKRCDYKTNYLCDIKKHLDRKTKCTTKDDNFNMSFKELYNQSIIKNIVDENNLPNKKKENNILCEYCQNSYYNKQGLERHQKVCKKKNNSENNKINDEKKIDNNNNNNNNTTLTQNNYYQNIETQNNLILNLPNQDIKEETLDQVLVPFFDKFDTSHINDEIKMGLLLSHLYYDTLKEILKNSVNLNFMLDMNQQNGLIYKNNSESLVPIDNVIICNNVWRKVRDYLLEALDFMKERYNKVDIHLYNHLHNQIKNKYNEFIKGNNKDYTEAVIGTINKVSHEKKEETEKIFKLISENKNNLIKN